MRVPPTSLRLDTDILEYLMGLEEALRYSRDQRASNIVVDGDLVVHGGLFVPAAITLGDDLVTVMDIDEYERRRGPSENNPCAEIPLAATALTNLGG